MFEAVEGMLAEHAALEQQLGAPETHADARLAKQLNQRYAALSSIIGAYRDLQRLDEDLEAARELALEDPGFAEEAESLTVRRHDAEERLRRLLVPRDPADDKDAILEVKSGEGGEESALFAGDLLRMYTRYAEGRGWKVEVLDAAESDLGGYKSVTVAVKAKGTPEPGEAPYALLKFEGGVHRVQRVPVTESQGRVHTSAAGVLVMPEAEQVDVQIDENNLRIDVFRSSGPGGQSVNTTDSAVRITHVPTGIVVACQAERSQHKNRATAMAMLKARLYEQELQKREEAANAAAAGKTEIGWGHQIRSYVLQPYQMVKDLRTGVESSQPSVVLDGDLDEFIEASLAQRIGGEAAAEA